MVNAVKIYVNDKTVLWFIRQDYVKLNKSELFGFLSEKVNKHANNRHGITGNLKRLNTIN